MKKRMMCSRSGAAPASLTPNLPKKNTLYSVGGVPQPGLSALES